MSSDILQAAKLSHDLLQAAIGCYNVTDLFQVTIVSPEFLQSAIVSYYNLLYCHLRSPDLLQADILSPDLLQPA